MDNDPFHVEEFIAKMKREGKYRKARWSVRWLRKPYRKFWWNIALPPYHDGRGPYVTIGLWFFAIYRGY